MAEDEVEIKREKEISDGKEKCLREKTRNDKKDKRKIKK